MITDRNKLLNTILFFAKETKHCNVTKLMKLLNFFDFEHFKNTGYPALCLEYQAWEHGPVPVSVYEEITTDTLPDDLKKLITTKTDDLRTGYKETTIVPKKSQKVNFDYFSYNEKKILEKLAFIYKDATAKQMSEISHEEEKPWRITKEEKGLYSVIDYMLAHDESGDISRELAQENINDLITLGNLFEYID